MAQPRTGCVCEWNAARRDFSVSALSSLRFTSGSPLTSSTPGVRGGARTYRGTSARWLGGSSGPSRAPPAHAPHLCEPHSACSTGCLAAATLSACVCVFVMHRLRVGSPRALQEHGLRAHPGTHSRLHVHLPACD